MNGVALGHYLPGSSPLHRLDPRTKIICLVAAAVAVLAASNWQGFLLSLGFAFAVAYFAHLPGRVLLGVLRSMRLLLIITFILQVLLTKGEVLAGIGPLVITREGLQAGVELFVRLALLILLASVLTMTTSPMNLTAGLENMLSPLRRLGVPSRELAMMMTIALRFVPTLFQEAQIVIKAQRSRGAVFATGSPAGWAKGMLPLFVPLFSGAIRRAEELAVAMEARCYRGGAGRTRMRELKLGSFDYIAVVITLAVMAGVLAF